MSDFFDKYNEKFPDINFVGYSYLFNNEQQNINELNFDISKYFLEANHQDYSNNNIETKINAIYHNINEIHTGNEMQQQPSSETTEVNEEAHINLNQPQLATVTNISISHRKMMDDSIRKRIKTKIEERQRRYLNDHYKGRNPRIRFYKLPSSFLKSPSIALNKKYLQMTIGERYKYKARGNSKNFKKNVSSVLLLERFYKEDKNSKSSLNIKASDFYKLYLEGKAFKEDVENIAVYEGAEYAKKYQKIGKEYLTYYFTTKPYNRKINRLTN